MREEDDDLTKIITHDLKEMKTAFVKQHMVLLCRRFIKGVNHERMDFNL